MKKLSILLFALVVVMVAVDGLLVLQLSEVQTINNDKQKEIVDLKNQLQQAKEDSIQEYIEENTNKISITDFSVHHIIPVLAVYAVNVSVTIQNQGINDVSDLLFAIESSTYEVSNQNVTINSIRAGECLNFTFVIGAWADSRTDLIATIHKDNILLDKGTLPSVAKNYFAQR